MALAEERRDKRERTRKKIRKEKRGYCLRLRSVTVFFFHFKFSDSLPLHSQPRPAPPRRPAPARRRQTPPARTPRPLAEADFHHHQSTTSDRAWPRGKRSRFSSSSTPPTSSTEERKSRRRRLPRLLYSPTRARARLVPSNDGARGQPGRRRGTPAAPSEASSALGRRRRVSP